MSVETSTTTTANNIGGKITSTQTSAKVNLSVNLTAATLQTTHSSKSTLSPPSSNLISSKQHKINSPNTAKTKQVEPVNDNMHEITAVS